MGQSALSTSDLNTTINHEPRIHDLRVAERLGMSRPRDIRQLIVRNQAELETYGELARCRTAPISGKGRVQEVNEYWLNEAQTLLICMLSRTPAAAAIRKEVIDLYMAYRRDQLPSADSTIALPPPPYYPPPFCVECRARRMWDNPTLIQGMTIDECRAMHPLADGPITGQELAMIITARAHAAEAVQQAKKRWASEMKALINRID